MRRGGGGGGDTLGRRIGDPAPVGDVSEGAGDEVVFRKAGEAVGGGREVVGLDVLVLVLV